MHSKIFMDDSPHLKMQGMQCIQQITVTAAVIKAIPVSVGKFTRHWWASRRLSANVLRLLGQFATDHLPELHSIWQQRDSDHSWRSWRLIMNKMLPSHKTTAKRCSTRACATHTYCIAQLSAHVLPDFENTHYSTFSQDVTTSFEPDFLLFLLLPDWKNILRVAEMLAVQSSKHDSRIFFFNGKLERMCS